MSDNKEIFKLVPKGGSQASSDVSPKESTVVVTEVRRPVVDEFPEGGLQAWLTIFGGVMIGISTLGSVQSFGVFQAYYTRTYLTDYSNSQISWIGSLQLCLLWGLGIISGRLFDMGYFRQLLFGGSLLYVFSSFMLSLAKPNQYYQIMLAQGLGMGLGGGTIFLPAVSVPSHYFRKRRALGMSFIASAGALGSVIYAVLLNELFEPLGFAWASRVAAFLNLLLLTLANLTMKTRLPPRTSFGDIKGVLTDSPYWILVAGLFLGFWALFFPFFYLQLFAESKGVSGHFLTWAIPIMNAGSTVGRFFPNFLSDMYGPMNVIIPSGIISAGLLWALIGVKSLGGVIAFGILYGFFSGGYLTVATVSLASTSLDASDVGLRIGVASFVLSLGLLTGNPLGGSLLGSDDAWWKALTFASVTQAVGIALVIISRYFIARRKGRQLV